MSGYKDAASPPSVEDAARQILAGTASDKNSAS